MPRSKNAKSLCFSALKFDAMVSRSVSRTDGLVGRRCLSPDGLFETFLNDECAHECAHEYAHVRTHEGNWRKP